MLSLLSTLLGILDKVFGYAAGTSIAKYQAEASLGVAEAQSMSAVEQKWAFVAWTIPLTWLPFGLWVMKAVAWDKVIGPIFGFHSVTDPLSSGLTEVMMIVFTGIFLHSVIK